MKVAHLTTTDISLRYLVLPQLLQVIAEGGEAIGISKAGPFVQELEELGIRHVDLPSSTRSANILADGRAIRELWHVLRQERPDVLHTHNPKPGVYGRILGRLAGIPVIVNTVHGLYATPEDPLAKRGVVYALEALASRFSDAELVQNPEDLELLRRLRLVSRKKSRLLGNGVDLARFDPTRFGEPHRQSVRRTFGIEDEDIVVGIVGRLVAEKGFPELFEAFGSLDGRYVLLAIGPHDPEKADALSEREIREAESMGVRFLGMRKDVDELYPAMDLFVLPSHREGFPRAAMEAAAMELPVVATDIRGCRQVVEEGVNGYLVPTRSPGALAQAIRELGQDPELRAEMGRASRVRAEAHFDERRVVEIVASTYRALIQESRGEISAGRANP
jgi:glycosyltransferase involved in cell wall biosynthesis